MIEVAVENQKPVRIGVNWGSLDQALLTRMMDENSQLPEPLRRARRDAWKRWSSARSTPPQPPRATACAHDQIILSAKVSGVQDLIDVYRIWPRAATMPLHLGLTEAGHGHQRHRGHHRRRSRVLLQEGIGDTIRVSLTPAARRRPHGRSLVGQQILQSLGIRSFTPQVTACPGCGRTTSTFFQEMAEQIQSYLREQMPVWKDASSRRRRDEGGRHGLRRERPRRIEACQHRHLAARHFEEPEAPVYVDGRLFTTLKGDKIVAEFLQILDKYVCPTTPSREEEAVRV